MKSSAKFPAIYIVLFGLLILTFVLLSSACYEWANTPMDYETQNIADYGVFVGNNEQYMHAYIERFFPDVIPEEAQNITYVFKSRAIDERAFEAYLEFVIEDEKTFEDHVNLVTTGLFSRPFNFDTSYQEYIVCDESTSYLQDQILLNDRYYEEGISTPFYKIESASIAKILVNYDECRIIYVAFSVFNGGAADTDFFSEYFNRFGLDPYEYELYTRETFDLTQGLPAIQD